MRPELESLLERDLLGPWDGPGAAASAVVAGRVLPPGAARSRQQPTDRVPDDRLGDANPDLTDREVIATTDDDEPDEEPEAAERAGSTAASALGLSFLVPADVDVVLVTAEWGRSERVP